MTKYDPVNHPGHYTGHPIYSGECWDITQHLSFPAGNAVKYLWRAGRKNNTLEDLKKAQWYLEHTTLEGVWTSPMYQPRAGIVDRLKGEWSAHWDKTDQEGGHEPVESLTARAILSLAVCRPRVARSYLSEAIETIEETKEPAGGMKPGDTIATAHAMQSLPRGSEVTDSRGRGWVKTDDRKWEPLNQELVGTREGFGPFTVRRIGDECPTPQVGDTVTTEAEYEVLPPGSIVAIDGDATAIVKFKSGKWDAGMGRTCDYCILGIPRTILRVGWEA